jgi:hypothetical protein
MKVNTMVKEESKLICLFGSEINSEGSFMKISVEGCKMALNFKLKVMEQRNLKTALNKNL